ncbi:hypothetical protein ACQPXH_18630 [Nocardia sp. CA-135953]|uniref:hypothetical protein n=1 Tax=Nocardia sp. CA-135953 TaxID=3239978 RepID=UPI003D96862E
MPVHESERASGYLVESDRADLEVLTDLVERRQLRPLVETVLPLEQAGTPPHRAGPSQRKDRAHRE